MKVLVTGATGLVGTALCRALSARGDAVLALSRNAASARGALGAGVAVVEGDPALPGSWTAALDGVDAVVHLAGENVFARRWSPAQKQRLRASRVDATRHLVTAMAAAARPPRVFVTASAVGYYGMDRAEPVDESAEPGRDFLARLCVDWEAAATAYAAPGARIVILRIGVVLAREGGALQQMLPPFKLGLGGPVAGGRQGVSWIHLADLTRLLVRALDDADVMGPVNATAPHPASNAELSRALARRLGRPCLLPVPKLALRVLFGEVAEVMAGGQRVLPAVAQAHGFEHEYATVDAALAALIP